MHLFSWSKGWPSELYADFMLAWSDWIGGQKTTVDGIRKIRALFSTLWYLTTSWWFHIAKVCLLFLIKVENSFVVPYRVVITASAHFRAYGRVTLAKINVKKPYFVISERHLWWWNHEVHKFLPPQPPLLSDFLLEYALKNTSFIVWLEEKVLLTLL